MKKEGLAEFNDRMICDSMIETYERVVNHQVIKDKKRLRGQALNFEFRP